MEFLAALGLTSLFGLNFLGSLALIAFIVLSVAFNYSERGWLTFVFAIAFTTALYFTNGVNVFTFIYNHPILTLEYVGIYLVIGGVWAWLKWGLTLRDYVKKYTAFKADWLAKNKFDSVELLNHSDFDDYQREVSIRVGSIPRITKYGDSVGYWWIYWPISMFWFLMTKPLKYLGELAYDIAVKTFGRLTRFMLRDVLKDLERK